MHNTTSSRNIKSIAFDIFIFLAIFLQIFIRVLDQKKIWLKILKVWIDSNKLLAIIFYLYLRS